MAIFHSFDTELADKYSVHVAIFLQSLVYWLTKNKANDRHLYEGRYWTYNSQDALLKIFHYWSRQNLRTVINDCVKHDLIKIGNFNQIGYDRTQWYALTDYGLSLFPTLNATEPAPALIGENQPMDRLESTNGLVGINQPIPNTLPVSKPVNKEIYTRDPKFSEPNEPDPKPNLPALNPNYQYPDTYFPASSDSNVLASPDNGRQTVTVAANETFERFWQRYPVKKGKLRAQAQWTHDGCYAIANQIIEKLEEQILYDKSFLDGFAPNPHKYIVEKRWEDEIQLRITNPLISKTGKKRFNHDDTSWANSGNRSLLE